MTLSKRMFDLSLLVLLCPILVPALILLALILAAWQGRPILFGSERSRALDQTFTLWKLRSMTQDVADAGVSGGDKLQRITPLGAMLRRTRLDELPQMWNILRGDISFVGPRPPLPAYVARFPCLYACVLQARPGVTGLASIVFAAHEEALLSRCTTPADTDATYARRCVPRKARIDLLYQRKRSLLLDAWLVIITGGRALGLIGRGTRLPRLRPHRRLFREAYEQRSCGKNSTGAKTELSSGGCSSAVMLPNQKEQEKRPR